MYVLLLITATTIGTVTVQRLGTFSDLRSCETAAARNNSLLHECCKSRRCIFASSESKIADGNASGGRKRLHRGREVSRPAVGGTSSLRHVHGGYAATELEPGLKENAFYDPTNFTFPSGVHICEVEVDPETGNTDIVAWTGGGRFRRRHQSGDRRGPGGMAALRKASVRRFARARSTRRTANS
jgi:Molybdopterin-binding domain of aldehyde dehydrogenase